VFLDSMFRVIVVALPVFLGVLGCGGSAEVVGSETSAIVSGSDDPDDRDVVALADSRSGIVCSGVLIDSRTVLTAAHCFTDAMPAEVLFGTDTREATSIAIADVRIHPGFERLTLANDLAVVTLASDVAGVPGPLKAPTDSLSVGAELRVVGFGSDSPDGLATPDAGRRERAGAMTVDALTPQTIHAVPHPATACLHDSGGAALAEGKLVGIVSGGDPDCARFTVFTRVDAYLSFIDHARRGRSDAGNDGAGGEGVSGCSVSQRVYSSPSSLAVLFAFACGVSLARRAPRPFRRGGPRSNQRFTASV